MGMVIGLLATIFGIALLAYTLSCKWYKQPTSWDYYTVGTVTSNATNFQNMNTAIFFILGGIADFCYFGIKEKEN